MQLESGRKWKLVGHQGLNYRTSQFARNGHRNRNRFFVRPTSRFMTLPISALLRSAGKSGRH